MIEAIDLRKRYRGRHVLNGVSFTAARNSVTCLIGINGAGKTTVLNAIMGLTPLGGGKVLIDGKAPDKRMYERVAYVPDRLTMPTGMPISAAMRFMADYYTGWNAGKAEELLRFFRLDAGERIGNLSKGMAAKFGMLLGFAQDADYVLLDEPFSGIDMFSREAIAEAFAGQLAEDRGVLLTTHEVGEIEHLIDKAVLLQDGAVAVSFDCEEKRDRENKSVLDVMREVYAP